MQGTKDPAASLSECEVSRGGDERFLIYASICVEQDVSSTLFYGLFPRSLQESTNNLLLIKGEIERECSIVTFLMNLWTLHVFSQCNL